MTVSIGAFSTNKLLVQPFGYEETDTSAGLTARKWTISGLLTAAEWQSLLSVYNTWRDARITDADTLSSAAVGTTVSLTANANGLTWSGIGCWVHKRPNRHPSWPLHPGQLRSGGCSASVGGASAPRREEPPEQ